VRRRLLFANVAGGLAVITFVLLLMATCVAYMRWRVAPIQSRRS